MLVQASAACSYLARFLDELVETMGRHRSAGVALVHRRSAAGRSASDPALPIAPSLQARAFFSFQIFKQVGRGAELP